MKTDYILKLTVVLICCFFCSCHDLYTNWQLSLENKSNRAIAIIYTNLDDEKFALNNVDFYIADWNLIKPDSTKDIVILGRKNAWHDYIEHGRTKKIYLYIFEVDTLKKYNGIYSMDDMVKQHRFSKLLDYSEKDLIQIHWKITFYK